MKIKNFLKKNLCLKLKQKKVNLTGFTFVELLIAISIITVLSFIAYSYYSGFEQKAVNAKVKDDLKTLDNSLVMLKQTKRDLPEPAGNNSFFDNSGGYSHSSSGAFGVYGKITKNILPDFSNSLKVGKINRYYTYGKNIDGNKYNLAGVIKEDDEFETILVGNYEKSESLGQPDSLIKSYDGPEFVTDKSKNNFPYNPEERKLTAKIIDFNGKIIINDTKTYNNPNELKNIKLFEGDKIKFEGIDDSQVAKIYYSDGSYSELSSKTEIILENMDYKGEDDLFTSIKIFLSSGKIYTKAAKLAKQSELEVYTTDTMVAVRGTIFSVEKNLNRSKTKVELEKGKIAISKIIETNENSLKQKLKTKKFTEISKQIITGVTGISTETKDDGTIESVLEVTETESPKSVEISPTIVLFSTGSSITSTGSSITSTGSSITSTGSSITPTPTTTYSSCQEYVDSGGDTGGGLGGGLNFFHINISFPGSPEVYCYKINGEWWTITHILKNDTVSNTNTEYKKMFTSNDDYGSDFDIAGFPLIRRNVYDNGSKQLRNGFNKFIYMTFDNMDDLGDNITAGKFDEGLDQWMEAYTVGQSEPGYSPLNLCRGKWTYYTDINFSSIKYIDNSYTCDGNIDGFWNMGGGERLLSMDIGLEDYNITNFPFGKKQTGQWCNAGISNSNNCDSNGKKYGILMFH